MYDATPTTHLRDGNRFRKAFTTSNIISIHSLILLTFDSRICMFLCMKKIRVLGIFSYSSYVSNTSYYIVSRKEYLFKKIILTDKQEYRYHVRTCSISFLLTPFIRYTANFTFEITNLQMSNSLRALQCYLTTLLGLNSKLWDSGIQVVYHTYTI